MTQSPSQSPGQDDPNIAELATGLRMLPADSPLKRLALALTGNALGPMPGNYYVVAQKLDEFAKNHPVNFQLPKTVAEISPAQIDGFLQTLGTNEMIAIRQTAGEVISEPTRRNFVKGSAAVIGAFLAGIGGTLKVSQMSQEKENKADHNPLPDEATLLLVGGSLVMLAGLIAQRSRRRENKSRDEAEKHLSSTTASILLELDQQMRQAEAALNARKRVQNPDSPGLG